jgi:hypothetical protein
MEKKVKVVVNLGQIDAATLDELVWLVEHCHPPHGSEVGRQLQH